MTTSGIGDASRSSLEAATRASEVRRNFSMIIDFPLLVGPASSRFGIRWRRGQSHSSSRRRSAAVARG